MVTDQSQWSGPRRTRFWGTPAVQSTGASIANPKSLEEVWSPGGGAITLGQGDGALGRLEAVCREVFQQLNNHYEYNCLNKH